MSAISSRRSSSWPSIAATSLTLSNVGRRVLADQTAVAQHRHSIRDLVHLVEEVRHEQDRGACVAEASHHPEELGDLVGVEARRGFVEDQHPRRDRRRTGDGDELLKGDRMCAQRGAGVDGQIELAEQFGGPAVHRAVVDPAPASRLAAQQNVLCHSQIGAEVDLLIDGADAGVLRLPRAAESLLDAVDGDAARVDVVDTGERLDQRGLAGAVLAHQRVDLAGQQPEVHAVERLDAREVDADVPHGTTGASERPWNRCSHRGILR